MTVEIRINDNDSLEVSEILIFWMKKGMRTAIMARFGCAGVVLPSPSRIVTPITR